MMKFGIVEVAVIAGVALLIFGPTRLPALGKAMGQTISNFKRSSNAAEEAPPKNEEA